MEEDLLELQPEEVIDVIFSSLSYDNPVECIMRAITICQKSIHILESMVEQNPNDDHGKHKKIKKNDDEQFNCCQDQLYSENVNSDCSCYQGVFQEVQTPIMTLDDEQIKNYDSDNNILTPVMKRPIMKLCSNNYHSICDFVDYKSNVYFRISCKQIHYLLMRCSIDISSEQTYLNKNDIGNISQLKYRHYSLSLLLPPSLRRCKQSSIDTIIESLNVIDVIKPIDYNMETMDKLNHIGIDRPWTFKGIRIHENFDLEALCMYLDTNIDMKYALKKLNICYGEQFGVDQDENARVADTSRITLNSSYIFSDLGIIGEQEIDDGQSFNWLENIEILTGSSGSQVDYGDVENIKYMKKLQIFDFDSVYNMEGNLSSFSTLTQLTKINISGDSRCHCCDVEGNINSLSTLKKLKFLDLSSLTTIHGNLSAFENLTNLEELLLFKTSTYGNFKSLSTLINLKKIDLCGTNNVEGDLSNLSSLTKLTFLRPNAIGELSSITNLNKLQVLTAQLGGDLKLLKHFPEMKSLMLYNVDIQGSLSSLNVLNDLIYLNLDDTVFDGMKSHHEQKDFKEWLQLEIKERINDGKRI